MEKLNCKKCGHKWIPRVDNPVECPKCKTYLQGRKDEKQTSKLQRS